MLFFTLRLCRVLTPLALLLSIHQAQAVTTDEMPYVGNYSAGTVDTRSQVLLLADNTFCVAFTGGSLDMLVGGRWQTDTRGQGGVRLQEVRQERTAYPAFAGVTAEPNSGVMFAFHGRLLSKARAPVFGVSATDAPPARLRPLFANDTNTWANRYEFPPMETADVKNFFVGQVEFDARDLPLRVKVTQYALRDANLVLIGFDRAQGRPLMDLSAVLNDGGLKVKHQDFRRLETLTDEKVERVRKTCIGPAFTPQVEVAPEQPQSGVSGDGASSKNGTTSGRRGPLVPVKNFYMDISTVGGEAYFVEGEPSKKAPGEPQIKSE